MEGGAESPKPLRELGGGAVHGATSDDKDPLQEILAKFVCNVEGSPLFREDDETDTMTNPQP
jgi:hypothetical protein